MNEIASECCLLLQQKPYDSEGWFETAKYMPKFRGQMYVLF